MLAPRLPVSLDPLIAEAKQRMRRRRVGLGLLMLFACAAALTIAFWPSGEPATARPSARVQADRQLARLTVPVDGYERKWRGWVAHDALTRPVRPSTAAAARRHIERYASASGLRVVRLKVWRTTATPSVELVVATASVPGAYLRDDLWQLLKRITGRNSGYVNVVDQHGTSIFERGYRPIEDGAGGESMVRVPPALRGCGWVVLGLGPPPPPCPAK